MKGETARLYGLPVVVALAACLPLFFYGYPYGHDWILELVRVTEYADAIRDGQVVPVWAGAQYHGFGSPIFLFYSPLYTALAAFSVFPGVNTTTAAVTALVLLMIIAAVGATGLLREIFIDRQGAATDAAIRVGAACYLLSPYFLADMFLRNASAEFTALCLAPYVFWGLAKLYHRRRSGFPLLAISTTLTVLAHNLTALVVSALVVLIALLLFIPAKRYRALAMTLTAYLLGIGMSAWFWLPALKLTPLVRIDAMTRGKFDFHGNFHPLSDMFGYAHFFAAGWLPVAILVLAAAALALSKGSRKLPAGLLVLALLFVFLQLPPSTFLWERLPFLSLFQFPWRMMGPFALVTAVLAGVLVAGYGRRARLTEAACLALILANAVPLFLKYDPLPENISNALPQILTPAVIRRDGVPATVLDEYLPRGANKRLSEQVAHDRPVYYSDPPADVSVITNRGSRIRLEVESDWNTVLHIARWYFPGWRAELDGKPHYLDADLNGALAVPVPAGKHAVEIKLGQPRVRRAGFAASGLFLVLFICLWRRRRFRRDG